MIKIIAAVGKNRELGKDNALMWELPGDMKFFRTQTSGHAVIMGRLTYESIGRPLPKRKNIVITRSRDLSIDGVTIVHSLEEALCECGGEDAFVLGGVNIYAQAIKYADEIILTEIDMAYPEADVFFPEFDKSLYTKETVGSGCDGGVSYSHVVYKKIK